MLGFQAESRVFGVGGGTFTLQGAIQVVPGVELEAGLRAVNLHGPARGWVVSPVGGNARGWRGHWWPWGDPRGVPALPGHQASSPSWRQAEVVVEAVQVELPQVLPQLHGLPEVKSGALHGSHLPWARRAAVSALTHPKIP